MYDRKRESREEIAGKLAAERGAIVVPSFEDPQIVAGQGTVGLEIATQAKTFVVTFDSVLAPCSGGGLTSGIALALSGASPNTRVIAVEPEGYDGARLSLAAGKRMTAPGKRGTIADALMSPAPGRIPLAILKACKAGAVAVTDKALIHAIGYAARVLKLVVEPGGAAALAAVLSGAFDSRGKTIAIVLSGGNIDSEMLVRCLTPM
jgi:threonine dehydratase